MVKGIDLNRLYVCREDPAIGLPIYMYKDQPGTYLKKNGHPATDAQASGSGFDLKGDRLVAEKQRRKDVAHADIEAEFAEKAATIDSDVEAEMAAEDAAALETKDVPDLPPDGVVMNSAGEVRGTATRKMVHKGAGVWEVIDKESGEVIKSGINKERALILVLEE